MTEKEKMLYLINTCGIDTFDGMVFGYLNIYNNEITTMRLFDLITSLNNRLGIRINKMEELRFVANERAHHLKEYLSGDMWKPQEVAKENVKPQIDNAQAIINACKCY